MAHRTVRLLLFAFIIFAGGISAGAQTIKVSGSFAETSIRRGKTAKGTIVLTVPEGLHINSNKPASEYAIPTTLRISGTGLRSGKVVYPSGTNRKFQFSETELNVYEGEISLPFSIAIPRNFRGKTLSVKVLVRYQACTEEVCYPPRNKEVIMTAAVK